MQEVLLANVKIIKVSEKRPCLEESPHVVELRQPYDTQARCACAGKGGDEGRPLCMEVECAVALLSFPHAFPRDMR